MLKIVKYPDSILRKTAKKIDGRDFDNQLQELAEQMAKAMYEDDGVGLAGPQVGLSKRIIVVGLGRGKFKTYINPEISFSSKDKISLEEGCLSLPKIFGYVERPKKIHVKFQDLTGEVIKEKLKGLDAVVLQHEIDHLNGILFIDRAKKITQGQDILDKIKEKIDGKKS